MKWVNKVQRKLGYNFGIPNLMIFITAINVLVYILDQAGAGSGFYISNYLYFSRALIFQGQVWRLITFIFVPTSSSVLSLILTLYFSCIVGYYLEREWSVCGFNLFYFIGMLGTIIGGLVTGYATAEYLGLSMFFAFAILHPNFQMLLFFIIPIKIKYLAYINLAFYIISLITESWPGRVSIIVSLLNLILFFGSDYTGKIKNLMHYRKQRNNFRREMRESNNRWR